MTTTADNTFTTAAIFNVKGARGLKKFIEDATKTVDSIRTVFQNDVNQFKIEEPNSIRRRTKRLIHDCVNSHKTFVENNILCNPSHWMTAEQDAINCLEILEKTRKMFVNNKQQKNTTIGMIRKELRNIHLDQPTSSVALIQHVRQNHNTIAKKILEQARFEMFAMKRSIVAYQLATETVVNQIIDRAEKSRAFIAKCYNLAIIEFCASAWWFETQKDPMDHNNYHVYVVDTTEEFSQIGVQYDESTMMRHRYTVDHSFVHRNISDTTSLNLTAIKIVVYGVPMTMMEEPPVIEIYWMNEDLADTILTEEAIDSFETAQGAIWKKNAEREM
jgi:hypothetical protein